MSSEHTELSDVDGADDGHASAVGPAASPSTETAEPSSSSSSHVPVHGGGAHPPVEGPDGVDGIVGLNTVYGRIAFHPKINSFMAACRLHQDCKLTRTKKAFRGDLVSEEDFAQGRPLGVLTNFLLMSDDSSIASREDHNNPFAILSYDHASRADARNYVATVAGSAPLFLQERDQRVAAGEPLEPMGVCCG